ncbi:MAG: tetratricopeptide repeat protein [Capsulimonadales bacterium]|nr:tetratricopeptide repeat protein [Capsulimonadales bacterium]
MATAIDRKRLREEEDLSVGPLLARAKLFRIRQQWDEAIAACTDALRKFPLSVTACSLLGEIYEAQKRPEDAAQWYAMALERDPESESDRAGLERMTAAQRAKQSSSVALKPANPAPVTPKPVTEKTLEWFDRLFPPGDSRSIARMLYAVSGIIVCVLLVIAVGASAFFRSPARRGGSDLPLPGTAVTELPAPPTPVVVLPNAASTPSGAVVPAMRPSPLPSAPPPSASSSPTPPGTFPASPMTKNDRQLKDALNGLLQGPFAVEHLNRSDGGTRIRLDVLVPAGENPAASAELALRATGHAAKLAAISDNALRTATVQAYVRSGESVLPVFSGDLSLADLRNIEPLQARYGELIGLFTRANWQGPLAGPEPGN